jgi:hypothetical protein
MPSQTSQIPKPRNLTKRTRVTSTIINSDDEHKWKTKAPRKKLAQADVSQDSPIKSYKKRIASELHSMSEYQIEQIDFNRMIMEGQYSQNESRDDQTKASGIMSLDAEEKIRNSQFGKVMDAEEAEIKLLKLDQMFVIDAS